MQRDDNETKEKILQTTIALIQEGAGLSTITVRDIAGRAGVGNGLINYHFQTKDNLINQCVQRIIGTVISEFDALYHSLDMDPLSKLKYLVKGTGLFLASNPGISRTSIQTDMLSPHCNDNTAATLSVYLPVVREVFGERKTDEELKLLLHMLISSLQAAFLRSDVFLKTFSIDFYDRAQRNAMIDRIIDSLFSPFIES